MNCLKQAHILETGIKLKRKNNTKTWPQPNTWKRVHLLGQEQNSADLSSATQKYFYKANTFTWDSENSWALKMKKEKKKWPDCDTLRRVYLLKQTKLTWSTSSNAKKIFQQRQAFSLQPPLFVSQGAIPVLNLLCTDYNMLYCTTRLKWRTNCVCSVRYQAFAPHTVKAFFPDLTTAAN